MSGIIGGFASFLASWRGFWSALATVLLVLVYCPGDFSSKKLVFLVAVPLFLVIYLCLKRADELEKVQTIDNVTGILNRNGSDRARKRMFQLAFRRARRPGSTNNLIYIKVFYLDLDNFKVLNDTHGHAAGDRALKAFAHILSETFQRPTDIVSRPGGDEFMVIVIENPDTFGDSNEAIQNDLIHSLRDKMSDRSEFEILSMQRRVTCSAGHAQTSVSASRNDVSIERVFDDLIQSADASMQENKKQRHAGR